MPGTREGEPCCPLTWKPALTPCSYHPSGPNDYSRLQLCERCTCIRQESGIALELQSTQHDRLSMILDTAVTILDWFGVVVFAVSGALVASRKQMDISGFALLGTVRESAVVRCVTFSWASYPYSGCASLLISSAVSWYRLRSFSRPTFRSPAIGCCCGSTLWGFPSLRRPAQSERCWLDRDRCLRLQWV